MLRNGVGVVEAMYEVYVRMLYSVLGLTDMFVLCSSIYSVALSVRDFVFECFQKCHQEEV